MDNKKIYKLIESEGLSLPSEMAVFSTDNILSGNFDEDRALIKQRLENSSFFKLLSLKESDGRNEDFPLQLIVELEYQGETISIDLSIVPAKFINLDDFSFGNQLSEEEITVAKQQRFYLETSMYFQEDPLESFHTQLKVMSAIIPRASVVVDFMPWRLLSGFWLKMTADSLTPPSPEYLFIIHAIYDENEKGERRHWLHTHGLHRCGSMELEMIDIGEARPLYDLLNTAAKMFIDKGPSKEGEPMMLGYDGMGVELAWLRWEESVKMFPDNVEGGNKDRQDDNIHTKPSGVLWAIEQDEFITPEVYAKSLMENPMYFISNKETSRMSILAKERFHYFERAFNEYKNQDDWSFMVKLGLTTNDATDENDREHLWFNVQKIENNKVTGILVNQPYWIDNLNEGDVKTFPIKETLTDWIIYSPLGHRPLTPDSIYQLYQEYEIIPKK